MGYSLVRGRLVVVSEGLRYGGVVTGCSSILPSEWVFLRGMQCDQASAIYHKTKCVEGYSDASYTLLSKWSWRVFVSHENHALSEAMPSECDFLGCISLVLMPMVSVINLVPQRFHSLLAGG